MQNKISLNKLKRGDIATIISFEDSNLPAKFFELGFMPGAKIEIKHKAPLNGPICVNIIQNNTLIALRVTEACTILTDKI
ncbi:FeoA family protein [Sphingobacterium rhinopitheci]|uniref:FeoA family protein n=1 Tax=Sphingobacterium rhinopitheci TaxID=2781960 RepID=UPI001F515CD1|nr:FeoA family protein [Sphingobacterium rhinopitheci]MCI0920023.1 ferrous iron transport protein A [Sphingobacterium rhinopitheci]